MTKVTLVFAAEGQHNRGMDTKYVIKSEGYLGWQSFQMATAVYDVTVAFCERHLAGRNGVAEQMMQLARGGRIHIVRSARRAEMSVKLAARAVDAARANFEELALDYEDFLRQRKLRLWDGQDAEAQEVRRAADGDAAAFGKACELWLAQEDGGIAANTVIYLLRRTDEVLEQQARKLTGKVESSDGAANPSFAPACPVCGNHMVLRTARQGTQQGKQFWGCSNYPDCKGIVNLSKEE